MHEFIMKSVIVMQILAGPVMAEELYVGIAYHDSKTEYILGTKDGVSFEKCQESVQIFNVANAMLLPSIELDLLNIDIEYEETDKAIRKKHKAVTNGALKVYADNTLHYQYKLARVNEILKRADLLSSERNAAKRKYTASRSGIVAQIDKIRTTKVNCEPMIKVQ